MIVREIDTKKYYKSIIKLLIEGKALSNESIFKSVEDSRTIFYGCFLKDKLVGIAGVKFLGLERVIKKNPELESELKLFEKYPEFGLCVVCSEFRRKGISKILINEILKMYPNLFATTSNDYMTKTLLSYGFQERLKYKSFRGDYFIKLLSTYNVSIKN